MLKGKSFSFLLAINGSIVNLKQFSQVYELFKMLSLFQLNVCVIRIELN